MNIQKQRIHQLESSAEFLEHLWLTTKDVKKLDQIKNELFQAQALLKMVKEGWWYDEAK